MNRSMNPIVETSEFEVRVFTGKESVEVVPWMSLSPEALFMVSSRFEYPDPASFFPSLRRREAASPYFER